MNLPKSFSDLAKSGFLKNMVTLMSGSVLSQLIEIGSAPITSRLFTPENFGFLALFGAIVGILAKVSSLCYDRAVVLPKSSKDAANLMALAMFVLLCFVAIIAALIALLHGPILELLKATAFNTFLHLVPLGILLSGSVQLMRYWCLREEEFKTVTVSRLLQSVVTVSVKIGVGFLIGSVSGGLIAGVLIGTTVGLISIVTIPKRFDIIKIKSEISLLGMKSMALAYKKFPFFTSFNALFNISSQNLIVFVFSIFFSPAVVGLYSLGNRILRQPITLLTDSVKSVYFQKASSQVARRIPVFPNLLKLTVGLFLIGIVPFGVIAVLGKYVFQLVFGESWGEAGIYVQIMAPWFLLLFAASPTNVIYDVLQIQDQRLFFNFSSAVFRAIAVILGAWFFKDPKKTIAVFVVVNVLFEIATIGWALFISYQRDRKLAYPDRVRE